MNTAPTPQWSEGFDSYPDSTSLATIGLYDTNGIVDSTYSFSGSKAAKHSMIAGSDNAQSYGFGKNLEAQLFEGDEFWIQARFYYPNNWDFGNSGNNNLGGNAPRTKFFRLQTFSSDNSSQGYNDVYLWKEDNTTTKWNWIYEGVQAWAFDGLDGYAPNRPLAPITGVVRGSWKNIEYYVKLHHIAGQAIVRLWEDGILKFEILDLATLTNSTDYASLFRYCTYVNGGAPANQDMWTDDWQLYTSASPPTRRDAANNLYIGFPPMSTLGNALEGTAATGTDVGLHILTRVQASADGTLNSIEGWVNAADASYADLIYVVYSDSAGAPNSLIGSSPAFHSPPDGGGISQKSADIIPLALTSGTYYWIGAYVKHDSTYISEDTDFAYTGWRYYQGSYSAPASSLSGLGSVDTETRYAFSGTLADSSPATANLTGASVTASAGTVVASGAANKVITGVSSTASAGTVIASGAASVSLTGVVATISAGTLTASGDGNATITGAGITTQAGTLTAGLAADLTPDQFVFGDVYGAALNTDYPSDDITVTGVTAATDIAISISGGTYAINSGSGYGSYTSSSGNVQLGYLVRVKLTSSSSNSTAVNSTLTIGGVSDTYTVTTIASGVGGSSQGDLTTEITRNITRDITGT